MKNFYAIMAAIFFVTFYAGLCIGLFTEHNRVGEWFAFITINAVLCWVFIMANANEDSKT